MSKLIDLSGRRFGRLVVIGRAENTPEGKARWLCRCDCGKENATEGQGLRSGRTKSCGCLNRENTANRNRRNARHGHCAGHTVTDEYRVWTAMITRCENKRSVAYSRYGGRGIKICERWRTSFENFLTDMGKRPSRSHSIDRIDNDGNYEPSNCRWATSKEQTANRRSNRLLTVNGETATVTEWAERVGILRRTLFSRIHDGWSDHDTVLTPVRRVRPR